jgi:hypothetical protein
VTNPHKVGLVIGAPIGGWHLVWSPLVLLGWAQPFIDYIFARRWSADLGESPESIRNNPPRKKLVAFRNQ